MARPAWEKLFDPESVALIGATPDKGKVGFALLSNLMAGKQRTIYPVNPGHETILGLKAYKSVLDVPKAVDLAVIAVRAEFVANVLTEVGRKKIPFAIIVSAGFKEIGPTGKALEDELVRVAKKYKITVLGPNCLGLIDTQSDLNASFAAQKPLRGNIAFISQSGALGTAMLDWAETQGIGFSAFVSLGNEAGLTELDLLERMASDFRTTAVLLYLEHITDGPRFMERLAAVTAKKPVVILKAGRSAGGARAVMSHTGSLAPENAAFTAACRASGAIVVETIRELYDLAKLFHLGHRKPLLRIAILTNGGGPSVVAADLVDSSPTLSLAELSQTTTDNLHFTLPEMAAVGNPVDIIGDAPAMRYEVALKALVADKGVDAIIVILTPQMMTETELTAEVLAEYAKEKPVLPVFLGGPTIEKGLAALRAKSLVNFDFPIDVVEALEALASNLPRRPKHLPFKTHLKHVALPKQMVYPTIMALMKHHHIPVDGVFVKNKDLLTGAIQKLEPGPYALKAISADIVHKTDAGGVMLNLPGVAALGEAWDAIAKNIKRSYVHSKIDGMVVQPMRKGREVIIGMKRDPVFGPVIVFGLGGIFVEAMKDTSLRVAPVDEAAAKAMLEEIKGVAVLKGLRGEKSVNFTALADIIVNLSKLALANPKIAEIDLNPVIVNDHDTHVVDARVLLA
ncbi:MAG TPA: acetate--CoA ligase family protein [Candidatus Paceibacterota bacterium]|nr:acetate--CoA ligase family protein [Candidatus Paceibacterota bacterium]